MKSQDGSGVGYGIFWESRKTRLADSPTALFQTRRFYLYLS